MDIIKYNTTFGSEWDAVVVIAGIALLGLIIWLAVRAQDKDKL